MKILLDHNLDWRLKRHLPGHDAASASELGWADLRNGELLREAEAAGFDVLLTGDANLNYQQNFTGRAVALVGLRAFDNRRTTHLPMMAEVLAALEMIRPGQVVEVLHEDVRRKAERDLARKLPKADE